MIQLIHGRGNIGPSWLFYISVCGSGLCYKCRADFKIFRCAMLEYYTLRMSACQQVDTVLILRLSQVSTYCVCFSHWLCIHFFWLVLCSESPDSLCDGCSEYFAPDIRFQLTVLLHRGEYNFRLGSSSWLSIMTEISCEMIEFLVPRDSSLIVLIGTILYLALSVGFS
jgi:hypothetical protein